MVIFTKIEYVLLLEINFIVRLTKFSILSNANGFCGKWKNIFLCFKSKIKMLFLTIKRTFHKISQNPLELVFFKRVCSSKVLRTYFIKDKT